MSEVVVPNPNLKATGESSQRRYASTVLLCAAGLMGIVAPVPALASWWVVRSADESCLVVDLEPIPGNEDITRRGKGTYQTAEEAEADLKRLCPESSFKR
jgi:hypothetical protein